MYITDYRVQNKWMDGWMCGQMDGQMDGWIGRQMDGWMDGWIVTG